MRRRLIVHFGMPRAGSSTLQNVLYRHRSKLEQAGVLYPVNSAETADSRDITSIYNHKLLLKSARRILPFGYFRTCHEEIVGRIRESDAAVVVLSYEGWWHPSYIRNLRHTISFLQEKAGPFDLSLVAAVRNPVTFLHSLYKLDVVRGHTTKLFEDYWSGKLSDPRLHYVRILDRIEKYFGPAAPVSLAEFEKLTSNGMLVGNMFSLMGLDGIMRRAGIEEFADFRGRGNDFFKEGFVSMFRFASHQIGAKRAVTNHKQLLRLISTIAKNPDLVEETESLVIPLRNETRLRIEQGCHARIEPLYRSRFGHDFRGQLDCAPDHAIQSEIAFNSRLGKAIVAGIEKNLPSS